MKVPKFFNKINLENLLFARICFKTYLRVLNISWIELEMSSSYIDPVGRPLIAHKTVDKILQSFDKR